MSSFLSVNGEENNFLPDEMSNSDKDSEDRKSRIAPSPVIGDISTKAMNNLGITSSPRPRSRSSSMKKPCNRRTEDFELEEIRPRTSSLPTRNSFKKPNLLTVRATAGILYEDGEGDFYTQRHFETTSKGGLVNRGDSLISRSTNSIMSSNSDLGALSRTSSSVSQGSICNETMTERPHFVLMLGAHGVGKTALTQQFMTSEYLGGFDTSIDGDQDKYVSVLLDGVESALAFIDHSYQEDFPHCNCLDAYVVVYSIDDRSTFDRAVDVLYSLRKQEQKGNAIILVGNKCELARTRNISLEEAKAVATTYDCKFIETSTVLNHNVDELLVGILSQIRLKQKQGERKGRFEHLQGCVARSKHLLHKIFKKDDISKSCENLYTL